MDCGDAGQFFYLSRGRRSGRIPRGATAVHDLGSCEVKRRVRVSVVNLYDDQFGNAKLPLKPKPSRNAGTACAGRSGRCVLALRDYCCLRVPFPDIGAIGLGDCGKKYRSASV